MSRLTTGAAVAARTAVAAASMLQAHSAHPAAKPASSLGELLSGVFGSVSMTAWICLLLPQLIQNYKAQSAEGLSMAFLVVWLIGDATNLSGALLTGLAPTAVALACYFCVADIVLISQCLYYNAMGARAPHHHRRRSSSTAVADESAVADEQAEEGDGNDDERPLLHRRSSSVGLPGSHRNHHVRRSESNLEPLRRIITGEDETPDSSPWLNNTLSLLAVWVVGAAGYLLSSRLGALDADEPVGGGDSPDLSATSSETLLARVGLVLGYASAVCYLCARVPQIIKNYREKSCEGLALLFFLLSLTGNFTYGASLVAYSQDGQYLMTALPWLLGSLGTMVEDGVIFVQFRLYAPQSPPKTVRRDSAEAVGDYGAA